MAGRVQRWIRPEVQALSAYAVPEATGQIKLDAMENPYTWPEALRQEWSSRLARVDVNRYPDPRAHALVETMRQQLDIPDDMAVLLGNGSDEIIQIIALALRGEGRCILSVEPGFVMYRMIALFAGMDYVGVPLAADDFSLDLPALLDAIDEHQPAVVFLAYPNNPTGNLFDADAVRQVIERAPGLVVVDEAYAPFADSSFMSELGRYPNLLVMRTFSKWGLAGLRLGYLVGPEEWLHQLDKLRMPYNINVLTQHSAAFALEHQDIFDQQTRRIREQRASLHVALSEFPGLTVFPSAANFILVKTEPGQAVTLFEHLLKQNIRIKNLHGSHALLKDCLRITVGSPEENRALLAALESGLVC